MPKRKEKRKRITIQDDYDGYRQLMQATTDSFLEETQELLDAGVNVNGDFHDGWTPLHSAAGQNTTPEIVELLLQRGANPNAQCTFEGEWYGNTPLIHAFDNEIGVRLSVLQALLDGGADINIQNDDGKTAMHKACIFCGDYGLGLVKLLMENGASAVDYIDKDGLTAFQVACNMAGDRDIATVKFLVESGSDLTVKCGKDGKMPLHTWTFFWACEKGHLEILNMLKENYGTSDFNAQGKDGKTPLHIACSRVELDMVQFLIENGAKVTNLKDENGSLPLHALCSYRWTSRSPSEVAKCLIDNGADLNAKDNDGITPSHLVYENERCDLKLGEFLVANGANLNATDNEDNTPLHLAFANLRWDAPVFMLENGADPKAKNKDGRTPFHFMFEYGCEFPLLNEVPLLELARLMIGHGADPNDKDKNGETVLHMVSQYGRLNLTQLLLSHGANVNERTTDGNSPLQVACKENHPEIVWFLIRQYPRLVLE